MLHLADFNLDFDAVLSNISSWQLPSLLFPIANVLGNTRYIHSPLARLFITAASLWSLSVFIVFLPPLYIFLTRVTVCFSVLQVQMIGPLEMPYVFPWYIHLCKISSAITRTGHRRHHARNLSGTLSNYQIAQLSCNTSMTPSATLAVHHQLSQCQHKGQTTSLVVFFKGQNSD